MTPAVRGRYTLDIAHLVGDMVVRRHITCLSMNRCIELEFAERIMPGEVYSQRSRFVPGDHSWTIEYPNPDLAKSIA